MARIATGPAFSNASGKFSGAVITNTKSGLVIRRAATFKKHQNEAQQESMARLKAAAEVWSGFDFQQAGAWDDFAQTVTLHNHLTGQPYHPSGYNAFLALATKVLQLDPLAEVPVAPPVGKWVGDGIELTVDGGGKNPHPGSGTRGPSPLRHEQPQGEGGGSPLRPAATSPVRGTHHPRTGEDLALVFHADAPNSPSTTTEILLEKLPNERRKATGRMTSAGFHQFVVGSLELVVPVEPGWYVAGYRFVEIATGRQTLAQVIGRVGV